MKKFPYTFLVFVLLMTSGSLFAQNDPLAGQDSIVLENERIEDVIESNKPFIKPPYQEIQQASRDDFQFNSADYYVETDFDPAPPVIKPWPKDKKEDIYNNSLSLGIGRFITPYAKLSLHNGRQGNMDLGLDFNHLSAHNDVIPLRKFRQDYGTLSLTSIQRDYNIGASAYVYNTSYFPYADTVLSNDEVAREDSLKIGFTRAQIGATLATNYKPDADYEADMGAYFRYFIGNRGNTESNIDLSPNAAYFITKEFKAGLESDLTFSNANLAEVKQTRFYLNATPYIGFDNGTVRIRGGVRYNFFRNSIDTASFSNFGGVIDLSAGVIPDKFAFLAGYSTGMTNYTYYDLIFTNPYLQRDVTIRPTIEKMNVYLGGKGNIGESVDYGAKIFYKRLENQLMYFTDSAGTYFDLVYDSLMTVTGTQVEVNFSPEDFLDIGATLNLNIYNTSTQLKYFHATPLRLDLYAVYRWNQKLTARGELLVFGARTTSLTSSGDPIKQGTFLDINLSGDYRVTDQFSIFLKVNNLLGSNYQRWHNYPERRIDFLGGLSIAF
ncbi:MAG: TonB-dependent receptor [Bacteroidia bacterium]|nr:TonB-dependent receptor [Bacteroidia bacterium]